MRNISPDDCSADAARFRELLISMGRMRSLRDPIAGACEAMQLTPPQLHSMMALGADGPLTMGDLARRTGVTEKTVTGIVDRLEKAGQVQRVRSESDRRVTRVALTRKGGATYAELSANMQQKLAQLLGLLDASDRKALLRVAEKLLGRMRELAADAAHSRGTGT
jgi:DNA-binding MarR family transcriptional regulator